MLKAKYFPECSLLEAVPQKGMSHTWRSILRGLDLLKEEIIWRVGSGESINVWSDPWIPRGRTRRPAMFRGQVLVDRVEELINPSTEQWDEELVNDLFGQEDAKEILAIPLRSNMEDKVAWHCDPKGVFTVKSAYRLGVRIREEVSHSDAGPSSASMNSSSRWNKLWSINLPAKVRIFLWRLAHDSLPTRMNIKRKHVQLETLCPVCSRFDEDGGHIFLKCKFVKQVWRGMDLEVVRLNLLTLPSAKAVVEAICQLNSEVQVKVGVLLWDWWTTRNKINAGEKMRSADQVCFFIRQHLQDFSKELEINSTTSSVPQIWKGPCANYVKINFDAAFHEGRGDGAYGYVVRSDVGEVIAGAAGKLNNIKLV